MKFRATSTLALSILLTPLATLPAQAQTFHTLYSFAGGSDGADPAGWLISDTSGNFYGVTVDGGADCPKLYDTGCGTIFQLTPSSNESVVHRFAEGLKAAFPSWDSPPPRMVNTMALRVRDHHLPAAAPFTGSIQQPERLQMFTSSLETPTAVVPMA
jgi:uncharacterized repeat protein (TIGR03803 family)